MVAKCFGATGSIMFCAAVSNAAMQKYIHDFENWGPILFRVVQLSSIIAITAVSSPQIG